MSMRKDTGRARMEPPSQMHGPRACVLLPCEKNTRRRPSKIPPRRRAAALAVPFLRLTRVQAIEDNLLSNLTEGATFVNAVCATDVSTGNTGMSTNVPQIVAARPIVRGGTTIAVYPPEAAPMRTHISLGRIFGIEVGLHYSWFLIAVLIVFSLGGYFRTVNPNWGDAVVWSLAALTGLLFFVSVILHELSHSLMAKARNLPVRSITLFALGGVSQIEKGANTARTEFLVAIVGPLTSLAIGGIALLLAWAAGWQPGEAEHSPVVTMLEWLGYINVALAVFNMIPGFPLDGGRVLRALLWWKSGDGDAATRRAARTGQAVGILFMAWGLGRFLVGSNFGGLWIALIGWFLLQTAGQSYAEVDLRRLLRGVRVADVMARDCPTVNAHSSVEDFIDETVLHTERRCFVVEMNGEPVGLLGAGDVRGIEPSKRPFTTVDQIMQPLDQMRAVDPDMPLTAALELMARTEAPQLPVVSGGRLDGVVSRRQVAQYLSTRAA